MRLITPFLCLTTACTKQDYELRHTTTLDSVTVGVALSEDGLDSYVGMVGMTCQIDTSWGCVVEDIDLPTEEEEVQDHADGVTLGTTEKTLHLFDAGGWSGDLDVAFEKPVQAARLTDLGPMAIVGDEHGCMLSVADTSRSIPPAACGDGVRVDVDRKGVLYVATAEGVYRFDSDGDQVLAKAGDLLALDRSLDQLYVATSKGSTVTSLNAKGEQRWALDLEGPIRSLAARGDKAEAMVLTETEDGGLVSVISGDSGIVLAELAIPTADGSMVISGNGRTLALVLEDKVEFYEVIVEGEEQPVDETKEEEVCPDASSGLAND